MKKICLFILCLCLFLSAAGCDHSKEKENMKQNLSILFIGNSYTYYNDMPTAIFEKMATAAGHTVDVTAITKGGWTLEKFADPKDEYGKKVHDVLTGEKTYDLVILQEQSLRPAIAPEKFFEAVENLSKRIRATGAEILLYSTWGRHSESADLEKHGLTNETMTYQLAASYERIGKKLDIPVAHAGLAFRDVYQNHPEIELYNPDRSHPSYAGSYLAAATLCTKIYGEAPEANAFTGELTEKESEILCKAAENAVKNPIISSGYKIQN